MDGEVKLDGGGQSQGNGTPVRWKIEGTALTISGSGPMTDYRGSSEVPWRGCAAAVTALVVEDGVTTLGDYAFYAALKDYYTANYLKIALPDSLIACFEKAAKRELKAYFDSWTQGNVKLFQ